jgi:hypothetical protein
MKNVLKTFLLALAPLIFVGCGPGTTGGTGGNNNGSSGGNEVFPVTIRAQALPGVEGDFLVDGELVIHGPSMEKSVMNMGTYGVNLNCPAHHFFDKEVSVDRDGKVTPEVTTWDPAGSDWCMFPNGTFRRESDGRDDIQITTNAQCRVMGLPIGQILVTGQSFDQEASGLPGRTIDGTVSADGKQITYNLRQDGAITNTDTLTLIE